MLQQPSLPSHVREAFLRFAEEYQNSESLFRTFHMQRLRSKGRKWSQAALWNCCCSCVFNFPRYTLCCHHRLCASCVVTWGRSKAPWTYEIARCPLCNDIDGTSFALQPPTAAPRILRIGGMAPENTLQFLMDLQRTIGISAISLREHFDIIIASEFGKSQNY